MDQSYMAENKRERERLHNLVSNITEAELTLKLYPEGWTIAVGLAHLAFWDQRRLLLVRKWKQQGITPSAIDENTINDVLLPFFLEIPPKKAAGLSVSVADELDRELEELAPDLVTAMQNTGDRHALNRATHRKMHLDDIEKLLLEKRSKR